MNRAGCPSGCFAEKSDARRALYLHIPFCASKCLYCDFSSWATDAGDAIMIRYRDALMRQLDELISHGLLGNVDTVYLGGGTPSLLGSELLPLVRLVHDAMDPTEFTCEANPDSLSDDLISGLRDAGATRLSIGVQSLNDTELRELRRRHDAALAKDRVRAAVSSGLDVSVDLMCATPAQTDGSWSSTLAEVLELGVSHVSVYPLQIEEGTPLEKRFEDDPCAWNAEDVQASRMEAAERVLVGAGFSRYEVASYSKPGHVCRHNIAYWTGVPYIGLGTGAASMLDAEGYRKLRTLSPHLPDAPFERGRCRLTVNSGREGIALTPSLSATDFDVEFLSEREALAEDLMLAVRMSAGVGHELQARAESEFGDEFQRVCGKLEYEGLLKREAPPSLGREGLPSDNAPSDSLFAGMQALDADAAAFGSDGARDEHPSSGAPSTCGSLVPTERGWLLGNELFGEFWGLAG